MVHEAMIYPFSNYYYESGSRLGTENNAKIARQTYMLVALSKLKVK